ncbi:hypothetical protein CSUI_007971, partial [Cystoisospora suis]
LKLLFFPLLVCGAEPRLASRSSGGALTRRPQPNTPPAAAQVRRLPAPVARATRGRHTHSIVAILAIQRQHDSRHTSFASSRRCFQLPPLRLARSQRRARHIMMNQAARTERDNVDRSERESFFVGKRAELTRIRGLP